MRLALISDADLQRALPMTAAIEAVTRAYAEVSAGRVQGPPRAHLDAHDGSGTTLVMSAHVAGEAGPGTGLGAKLVSVFPGAEPPIQGLAILLDPSTGTPRALIEGSALTAWRTAAATGVGVRLLAREDASAAVVIGTGAQAYTQVLALLAAREFERVEVYGRDVSKAAALVARLVERDRELANRVTVCAELEPALATADVVATATSARSALFSLAQLKPGAHLSLIGSFTEQMREVDVETVAAAEVFVDQREAALEEAGELIAAHRAGRSGPEDWVEIGDVASGRHPGRSSDQALTLFKSVGLAAQDVIVGQAAWEALGAEARSIEL